MTPALTIVTATVVSAIAGNELACITAVPTSTPVTSTVVLVAPPANVTLAGTLATFELLEVKLRLNPWSGAREDKYMVSDWT